MQRTVIIFSFLLSLVLLTTAEQQYVTPSAPSDDQLMRAKAAYNRWLESGTATAEEKTLVEEYLRFTSPVNEKDDGGNPLTQIGGPDSSGYRYVDNQPPDTAHFQWIDLCADPQAQNGPQGDDVLQPITWTTPFPFYGQVFNSASLTTNGALGFGANAPGFSNSCEPRATTTGRFIYLYWDDLDASLVGGCLGNGAYPWIRYRDFGDKIVIEYKGVRHHVDDARSLEGEIILYPDGRIKLQYNVTHTAVAQSATIGIERPGTSNGLGNGVQYSCNVPQSLGGRAIWFYNPPPTTPDLVTENLVPCGAYPFGPQQVSVRVRNAGVVTAPSTLVRYRFDGIDSPLQSVPPLVPASFFDVVFSVPINLTEGQHSLIAFVNSVDPAAGNDTTRCASLCGSPINDGCENAFPLVNPSPGSPTTVSGSTSCASMSCSENNLDCDYASNGPDVFYTLTLNTCRRIDINLTGGDMHLSVYAQGMCCLQPPLLCNDDYAHFIPPPWADPSHIPAGALESYVAAELNPGLYYIRVGRFSSGSGAFTLNVFDNGPCPAPCGGTVALNINSVSFPVTYVGNASSHVVQVSNTGSTPLCIGDIVGADNVWGVSPSTFTLQPGQMQLLNITFMPTFEHDFKGSVELIDGSSSTIRASILLYGSGCHPVRPPLAPALYAAGSPNAIYFAPSWDLNDHGTLYAVEVSTDNFSNSMYVDEYGDLIPNPEYHTAGSWGQESALAILGLQAETPYQVRCRAEDCAGAWLLSPSATYTTPPPIPVEDHSHLVLQNFPSSNEIHLSWDNVVRDNNGRVLPILGWAVMRGVYPDLIDSLIGINTTGAFSVNISSLNKAFFQVVPIVTDFDVPHPFIAWPPDNAVLSGLNTVIVQDYLHEARWDSFRCVIDPSGPATVIGTNSDDIFTESEKTGFVFDFSDLPAGEHTVTIIVYDCCGNSYASPVELDWVVDSTPDYISFDAIYDDTRGMFVCDTLNGSGIDSPLVDIWWQNTQGQEGFGPIWSFPWLGGDSLILVKPFPITVAKVLTETPVADYRDPLEHVGTVPQTTDATIDLYEISCCCDNLEILTSGTARGEYQGEKNRRLGAKVRCEDGNYLVDYAFEVVITYKYYLVESGGTSCSCGQDCKRTDTRTVGNCVNGAFVPLNPAVGDTSHKKVGNTEYPRDGSSYGNDHYGSRPGDSGTDRSELGRDSWYDRPKNKGELPTRGGEPLAIRVKRTAQFFARADPNCEPQQAECCRQWDLDWDVTFCEDCDTLSHQAPIIHNEITPANCPALAQ